MSYFVPKKNKGVGAFVCLSDEWVLHGGAMQRAMLKDKSTAIDANDFPLWKGLLHLFQSL